MTYMSGREIRRHSDFDMPTEADYYDHTLPGMHSLPGQRPSR